MTNMSRLIILSLALILGICNMRADESKVILEGKRPQREYSLSDFNRIYFYDSGLKIASSHNPVSNQVSWSYEDYNLIRLKMTHSDIDDNIIQTASLKYSDGKLWLTCENVESYVCKLYNVAGMIVETGVFTNEGTYSVAELPTGIYFAIVGNSESRMTLKFIKK